ncbi:MAG TPA: hypothetical protein VN514_00280 [Ignavibacteria bacterium]|nr:hypothetical protein [Ignavibacteria bacterium]
MLGFGKKKDEDPKDALNKADKALNKGVSGFMAKTFMGKDFVNKANEGLDMAKQYTDYDGRKAQLMATGLGGTAEVLSIADTGAMINYNPVVKLKLKVQPQYGPEFETEIETAVSKIAVPRAGDKINIKYNPANTSELIIV